MIVRLDVVLRRGLGRHRPDRRDDRRRSRSAAGSAPSTRTKFRTADGLVNVTTSIRRRAASGRCRVRPRARDRRSRSGRRSTSVTSAPRRRSSSATTSRPMSARGSSTRRPVTSREPASAFDERLGAVLGRHEVDLQAQRPRSRSAVAGPTAHSFTPCSARRSSGVASSRSMNASTALALANTIQSNSPTRGAGRRRAARSRRAARFGSSALRSLRRRAPRAARRARRPARADA